MPTECSPTSLDFGRVSGRRLVADFDGGAMTSNAGALLLRQVAKATGMIERLAGCFEDHRSAERVEHALPVLLGQRVLGLAPGYEDLNDHDNLRKDVLIGACLGKLAGRRSDCEALAGRNTLNRLERSPAGAPTRYHKIGHDPAAIERMLVELFVGAHAAAPEQIILDLDASDLPLHGDQEGKVFHGYYGHYCYLPLYVFCGDHLLAARLRPANVGAASGALDEVRRIVEQIRGRWPGVRVILRADSGFVSDDLMSWAEQGDVDYVIGVAKNSRLIAQIENELEEARAKTLDTGSAARVFADFTWSTRKSWSKERRVVAKAEALPPVTSPKSNPRFVVTSFATSEYDAKTLYQDLYCARGNMENRIKETQLDLFGTRVSASSMRANQLRLLFSGLAYTLLKTLQRMALAGTALANASPHHIRLSLLKLGARVTVSARRVHAAIASACPHQAEFALAHARLAAAQNAF